MRPACANHWYTSKAEEVLGKSARLAYRGVLVRDDNITFLVGGNV